jgi:hypothetical protein
MLALALGSLGALCAACYHVNGAAAFSRAGISGALFSFGGVYGHKRPISEVSQALRALPSAAAPLTTSVDAAGDVEHGVCIPARPQRARLL